MNDHYLRDLVRYQIIPCTIALAVFAAIVVPDGGNLGWARFTTGCAVMVMLPAILALAIGRWDRRRAAQ